MNISSGRYEELVQGLASRIAVSRQIKLEEQPRYGRSNKILGATGVKHQIDVSAKYISRDGTHRLKLIECKLRAKDKIGLGALLSFHARILDIQNRLRKNAKVEGNFVTTAGYTSGARKYAEFYGIATNSMQTDGEAWSISFADDVVIGLRSVSLKATNPRIESGES